MTEQKQSDSIREALRKLQDVDRYEDGVTYLDEETIDEIVALLDQEKKAYVKQVLPEKKTEPVEGYHFQWYNGWDACLDKVAQTIRNMESDNV